MSPLIGRRTSAPSTPSAPTRVKSLTAAEIAELDAGAWKDESFVGLQVPTLAEVLALVHTTRTGLLLEVKHPNLYPGIAEAIVRACDESPDYLDRSLAAGLLVVQSADWDFVREFHELAPEVPVGLLGRPTLERANSPRGSTRSIPSTSTPMPST